MEPARLSLVHLIREPAARASGPPPLLLLLHGVGSHEGDLIGLAPYVDPRFFVVSARAPITLAPGAYAWFHVEFTAAGPVIVPEEAESSRVAVIAFIGEAVRAYGLDARALYLMGFSQGAILSLSIALTRPELLAGVVAMSGRVLPEVRSHVAPREALAGLPVFIAHGVYDPVLPIEYGRDARDVLAALPVALTYREYPMAHQVSAESLSDITTWLTERLDAAQASPQKVRRGG